MNKHTSYSWAAGILACLLSCFSLSAQETGHTKGNPKQVYKEQESKSFSVQWMDAAMSFQKFQEYRNAVDGVMDTLRTLLAKTDDKSYIDKQSAKLHIKQQVMYFYYYWGHQDDATFSYDPAFADYVKGIDINDMKTVTDNPIGSSYIRWQVMTQKGVKRVSPVDYLEGIDRYVTNQACKDKLAFDYMENYFINGEFSQLSDVEKLTYRICRNQDFLDRLAKRFQTAHTLKAGEMAPDFAMFDAQDRERRLSDLRGKMLFIDVWATWCGWCLKETPFLQRLYERYKDNSRIAFISISVDQNVNAWKKKVAAEQLPWEQYCVSGGTKSEFCRLYDITGIPRFLMIDAEGRIISVSAPRPSSQEILQFMNKHLQ